MFPVYTPEQLTLPYGACQPPNADSLLQLPSAGAASAATEIVKGRSSGEMVLEAAGLT